MTDKNTTILLIDDELSICTGVCGILEMEGYNAEYVLSADEGIAYLNEHPDLDIILLDVNLGQGMNGLDALKMIKEKNKFVQVIMLTSEDRLDICLECMKRGALDYLTKPFNNTIFSKIAATACERKHIEQIRDLYFNMIIHDLKNPLQVISGAYEMLNDTLKETGSPIQQRLLEAADNGIRQIQMIIGNVIGVTSFEKNSLIARRQQININELVEKSLGIFENVTISYSDTNIQVNSDSDLYVRIITNLVSNALRFAVPGSNVSVDLKLIENNSFLLTSVTNQGSYIAPEIRSAVFDKFLGVHSMLKSARGQNFGLGLTFSKMAVEALNGKIWIEGDMQAPSTTFNFTIRNFE